MLHLVWPLGQRFYSFSYIIAVNCVRLMRTLWFPLRLVVCKSFKCFSKRIAMSCRMINVQPHHDLTVKWATVYHWKHGYLHSGSIISWRKNDRKSQPPKMQPLQASSSRMTATLQASKSIQQFIYFTSLPVSFLTSSTGSRFHWIMKWLIGACHIISYEDQQSSK